jgi:histidinol dehydrogenase
MTPESAVKSAPFVAEFARVEGLDAHGHSMEVRALRASQD